MATFVCSDHHFNHTNILLPEYSRRGIVVSTVDDMNDMLIERHNSVVGKNDECYLLGDFCWYGGRNRDMKSARSFFDALNGKKHLVIGNHDQKDVTSLPWLSVAYQTMIKRNRTKITLNHCPMLSWFKGIMVHGHIHTQEHLTPCEGRFCVSVDLLPDYKPVEVKRLINESLHHDAR